MGFIFLHERWFVHPSFIAQQIKDPFFSSWNHVNLAYTLAAIGVFILAIIIHFLLRSRKWVIRLRKKLTEFGRIAPTLLRTFTGILLLIVSLLFVPHGEWHGWNIPVTVLTVLVSLSLITGIFVRIAAFFGMLFYLGSFFLFRPLEGVQYLFLFGVFLYLFIAGAETTVKIKSGFRIVKFLQNYRPYALPLLRIFTGLSLILASLWNKIINPRPALAFIAGPGQFLHPFISMLGMTVPQFIFAMGLCELVIGALILFGFLTRLCGLKLILLFLLGIVGLGIPEFIGHLPLIAISYALLTLGPGEKWSFEQATKSSFYKK